MLWTIRAGAMRARTRYTATTSRFRGKVVCSDNGMLAFGCEHVGGSGQPMAHRVAADDQTAKGAHVLRAIIILPLPKVTVSANERMSDRDAARKDVPRHPSNDPSGDEPAGSSTGIPRREFSDGTRVSETPDAPIRTDAPPAEQATRRAARDREGSEE